eukprot:2782877-Rhodomonas_salina.2
MQRQREQTRDEGSTRACNEHTRVQRAHARATSARCQRRAARSHTHTHTSQATAQHAHTHAHTHTSPAHTSRMSTAFAPAPPAACTRTTYLTLTSSSTTCNADRISHLNTALQWYENWGLKGRYLAVLQNLTELARGRAKLAVLRRGSAYLSLTPHCTGADTGPNRRNVPAWGSRGPAWYCYGGLKCRPGGWCRSGTPAVQLTRRGRRGARRGRGGGCLRIACLSRKPCLTASVLSTIGKPCLSAINHWPQCYQPLASVLSTIGASTRGYLRRRACARPETAGGARISQLKPAFINRTKIGGFKGDRYVGERKGNVEHALPCDVLELRALDEPVVPPYIILRPCFKGTNSGVLK